MDPPLVERPTSAPPAAGSHTQQPTESEAAYAQWYYLQQPPDPRAPRPNNYFTKYNTITKKGAQGGEEGEVYDHVPLANAPLQGMDASNQKSLVDKIQEDFPRTPSPVYGTKELGQANNSGSLLPGGLAAPIPTTGVSALAFDTQPPTPPQHSPALQPQQPPTALPSAPHQPTQQGPPPMAQQLPPQQFGQMQGPPAPAPGTQMQQGYRASQPHPQQQQGNMGMPPNMQQHQQMQYPPQMMSVPMQLAQHQIPQQQQQQQPPYNQYYPVQMPLAAYSFGYTMDENGGYYAQAIPQYEQAVFHQPQDQMSHAMRSSFQHQQHHDAPPPKKDNRKGRTKERVHEDHAPRSQLMEEFRNQKNRRWELRDLVGHMLEFSKDQEGSRLIQRKLEFSGCSEGEKELVFSEVYKDALALMTDVFGNYVIQKLFEHGLPAHRAALAEVLRTHVLHLTLQTYGCRVIQKALEVVGESEQAMISQELDGHILRCVLDQNGNHVIQKCIERIPPHNVKFIVQAFVGNVQNLAVHAYGCRVIQRILEYCEDHVEVIQPILDEILDNVNTLVRDQYGNYVVQHVLINGRPVYQYAIIERLRGDVLELSTHKFASNVVEKMFQHGSREVRHSMMMDLMKPQPPDGCSALLSMMKDQYANYVVQKILDVADDSMTNEQRRSIVEHIKPHVNSLRRYTYGKHLITRIEKLSATKLL
eukprot:TRINITY_DN65846_c5_g1_i1.p1 TRINITY_DN65846_c5_g1~~TRINITY_DN65846_c5_g1_i1.p1  ORF type:complete len:700 (+),score=99.20 TRINITY_DN65846_c5_g1_i1:38-2137(+)